MKRVSRTKRIFAAIAALGCVSGTALAHSQVQARDLMLAHYDAPQRSASAPSVPRVLSDKERKRYTRAFAAIEAQDWEAVEDLLEDARGDVLYQVTLAEYYTHAKSPRISAERIAEWLQDGVHLPQSEQLGRMGARRGVANIPDFPTAQSLRYQPEADRKSVV